MNLRFVVPQSIFLKGFTRDKLDASASFKYKGYKVSLVLTGGEPKEATWEGAKIKWYRRSDGIQITLTDDESSAQSLTDLCSVEERNALHGLLLGVTIRALRVIRNVGIVPELPETLVTTEDVDQ